MSDHDPVALRDLAVATAREAGELIVRLRREGVEVAGTKSSDIDIVTAADRASERLVLDRLLGARPDDGLVGEEGDDLRGTSGVIWIVDPIDGTVNYLYGLPHFAVSIAAEVDGDVVAGVVLAPGARAGVRRDPGRRRDLQRTARPPAARRTARTAAGRHRVQLRAGGAHPRGGVRRPAAAQDPGHPPPRLVRARHLRRRRRPSRRLRRGGCPHLGPRGRRTDVLRGRGRAGGRPGRRAASGCCLAAPADGFAELREAVVDAGFVGGEGPHAPATES